MPRQTDPKNLERLLEAAAELFLVEGYDGASMQQLADSVGLHKSSLYHYVNGKEDLLGKLTDEAQTAAAENLKEAEAKKDKKEAFIDALTFAIDQTLNDIGKVSLVLRQKPDSVTGEQVANSSAGIEGWAASADGGESDEEDGSDDESAFATLLRKHGGKTGKELKAEGK